MVVGCGPIVDGDADGDGSTTGATTSSTTLPGGPTTVPPDPSGADVATGVPPDPATTVDPDATVDPDSGSESTGTPFIVEPDGGACFTHCGYCDVWSQDCPRGEKCTAWANDGGSAWNATRCSPYGEDEPGDPCTVEGSAVTGLDSCTLGAMCWNVDSETNEGECVALCGGSEANPECAGACETCIISNEGVLNLCLSLCNPLAPECGEGQACMHFAGFICVPAPADTPLGGTCDSDTDCQPGLRCAPAAQLPACEGASCCAPWCDPSLMDACAALPGTECVPVDEGVPGCVPEVGACVLP